MTNLVEKPVRTEEQLLAQIDEFVRCLPLEPSPEEADRAAVELGGLYWELDQLHRWVEGASIRLTVKSGRRGPE